MTTADFDWTAFEDELYAELHRALTQLGAAAKGKEFYAVALYGVYRELDRTLTLPLLAAATVAGGAASDEEGFWGARWNPSDWEFTELQLRERPALRMERALTDEAIRSTQAHFNRVEARYFRVLVKLCKRLRDATPAPLRVSDDFVVFVFDPEWGAELAAKSIPKRRFEALFPAHVQRREAKAQRAALSPEEQAAFLVTRFNQFQGVTSEDAQRELLLLAERAVPALLSVVDDKQVGWTAAKVLGQIGHASPAVIGALRAKAPSSFWHAMALGVLGDQAWLATQPANIAVPGLCGPLKAITSATVALDYAPLERYLDEADAKTRKQVDAELAPGSSYLTIVKGDVPEAVRGLASKHAVVRWHAAAVLNERGLGPAVGKVVLPALAARLGDHHSNVRRIAVLSIAGWKAAALPYRPQVEALRADPNETVRQIVAHVLDQARW